MTTQPNTDIAALVGSPRREYPAWMGDGPYTPLQTRLAETLGRIANRTDAWQREEAERRRALAWCRSNGNPHMKEQSHDGQG